VCRHLLKKGELTRLDMALMAIDSDIFSCHLHGSAPTSFERQFRSMRPLLYNRLQAALPGEVGWGEVLHWMWPLFTERWAAWRSDRLHLSPCPLTDPVTELPNIQDWPSAAPLLYGFSQDVVECPVYWPTSVFVCGFWYAPMDWEVSETGDIMSKCAQVEPRMEPSLSRCLETGLTTNGCPFVPPVKLHLFLSNERGQEQHLQSSRPPIFVGLSSIGRFVPNSFFPAQQGIVSRFIWMTQHASMFLHMQYGVHEEPRGHVEGAKSSPGSNEQQGCFVNSCISTIGFGHHHYI
jgi:hypothetical protein